MTVQPADWLLEGQGPFLSFVLSKSRAQRYRAGTRAPRFRDLSLEPDSRVQPLDLSFISYVTLGKLLNLFVPPFPHVKNGETTVIAWTPQRCCENSYLESI